MRPSMSLRRSAAWLAAFAMALQALWPLIAQAKPRSSTLVPICTVDGVTHYFELKKGDTPLEKRTTAQQEHCGFCLLGGAAALPAALHTFYGRCAIAGEVAHAAPPPAVFAPFSPARPRAPPAFS